MNLKKWIGMGIIWLYAVSAYPCSCIVVKNNEQVMVAKNFDWFTHQGYIIHNPAHQHKEAYPTHTGNRLQWTAKYSSITFNQNGIQMPYGGINEKGLVAEMLWMEEAVFNPPSSSPYLNELEWIQYQLDQFETIEQVIDHLYDYAAYPVKGKIHYIVADAKGHSAVIDYSTQGITVTRKPPGECQIITNDDAVKSELNFTTLPELPAYHHAGSLQRYKLLRQELLTTNLPANNQQMFTVIQKASILKGPFITQWTYGYNLTHMQLWIKHNTTHKINTYDLKKWFTTSAQTYTGTHIRGLYDTTGILLPLVKNSMLKVMRQSYKTVGIPQLNAREVYQWATDTSFRAHDTYPSSFEKNYTTIHLRVSSTKKDIGFVRLACVPYNSNIKILQQQSILVYIKGSEFIWGMYGMQKGPYIALAYVDENNNRVLDMDKSGNPTEPYILSNKGKFTQKKSASVDCVKDFTTIELNLP